MMAWIQLEHDVQSYKKEGTNMRRPHRARHRIVTPQNFDLIKITKSFYEKGKLCNLRISECCNILQQRFKVKLEIKYVHLFIQLYA